MTAFCSIEHFFFLINCWSSVVASVVLPQFVQSPLSFFEHHICIRRGKKKCKPPQYGGCKTLGGKCLRFLLYLYDRAIRSVQRRKPRREKGMAKGYPPHTKQNKNTERNASKGWVGRCVRGIYLKNKNEAQTLICEGKGEVL